MQRHEGKVSRSTACVDRVPDGRLGTSTYAGSLIDGFLDPH